MSKVNADRDRKNAMDGVRFVVVVAGRNKDNDGGFRSGMTSSGMSQRQRTTDAAGRIGIFPMDLPELFHDAADSG